jgi:hypothetical protein
MRILRRANDVKALSSVWEPQYAAAGHFKSRSRAAAISAERHRCLQKENHKSGPRAIGAGRRAQSSADHKRRLSRHQQSATEGSAYDNDG